MTITRQLQGNYKAITRQLHRICMGDAWGFMAWGSNCIWWILYRQFRSLEWWRKESGCILGAQTSQALLFHGNSTERRCHCVEGITTTQARGSKQGSPFFIPTSPPALQRLHNLVRTEVFQPISWRQRSKGQHGQRAHRPPRYRTRELRVMHLI